MSCWLILNMYIIAVLQPRWRLCVCLCDCAVCCSWWPVRYWCNIIRYYYILQVLTNLYLMRLKAGLEPFYWASGVKSRLWLQLYVTTPTGSPPTPALYLSSAWMRGHWPVSPALRVPIGMVWSRNLCGFPWAADLLVPARIGLVNQTLSCSYLHVVVITQCCVPFSISFLNTVRTL